MIDYLIFKRTPYINLTINSNLVFLIKHPFLSNHYWTGRKLFSFSVVGATFNFGERLYNSAGDFSCVLAHC